MIHLSRRPQVLAASMAVAVILLLAAARPSGAEKPTLANVPDVTTTATVTKEDYLRKAALLGIPIRAEDTPRTAVEKIAAFIAPYQADPRFADDRYALATIEQAIRGGRNDDYCIGAILVDPQGTILLGAHNSQRSRNRSDLHGEMTLLTEFESAPRFRAYRKGLALLPGMRVYSSAEPCPMCLIRLATVGAETRFVAGSLEDGMASRIQYLPGFWRKLCEEHPCVQAGCAPVLRSVSHMLFYSFLLYSKQ